MDNLPKSQWYYESLAPGLVLASGLRGVIHKSQTIYQRVEVLDTVPFGRSLVLDGKTQSSEADEFVYHEALVHPVLVTHPSPERILVAGGGEGATIREIFRNRTVSSVVMVDLDAEVVDLCRKYLPDHHKGAFDDTRLKLVHEDVLAYLQQESTPFDVIILDVPDPLEAGPAFQLYTREFFQLIRSRLSDDGLMVVQAGPCGPINHTEVFTAIHKTVASVFPITTGHRACIPSFGSVWGFVVGSSLHDPQTLAPEEVNRRLAERGVKSLRFYDGLTHQGIFALPKYVRVSLEKEERLITRENPVFAV